MSGCRMQVAVLPQHHLDLLDLLYLLWLYLLWPHRLDLLDLVRDAIAVLVQPTIIVHLHQETLEAAVLQRLAPVALEHAQLHVLSIVQVLSVALLGPRLPQGIVRVPLGRRRRRLRPPLG